jgi:hypothetical protein
MIGMRPDAIMQNVTPLLPIRAGLIQCSADMSMTQIVVCSRSENLLCASIPPSSLPEVPQAYAALSPISLLSYPPGSPLFLQI